jgi:phage-related holin
LEKFNIQIVIAFLGTIASALFGELILVFRVLVGLIIIDFIVGSLKAIYLNNLSSREM